MHAPQLRRKKRGNSVPTILLLDTEGGEIVRIPGLQMHVLTLVLTLLYSIIDNEQPRPRGRGCEASVL